jgi:hypothetical protein
LNFVGVECGVMSVLEFERLHAVEGEVSLVPKDHIDHRQASPLISLGDLREYALSRYRLELASFGSPPNNEDAGLREDRDRKDRAKVNQYSSAAFVSVAKREGGWDAPAKAAIEAALVLASQLPNNRKPRAELNRALGHLKQLQKRERCPQPKAGKRREPSKKKDPGPLAQLLSATIKEKRVSYSALAQKVEINPAKLWKWVTGECEPSDEAKKIVEKIEVELGIKVNRLWGLRRQIYWPAGIPACKKVRRRILRKCPGLADLPPDEQEAAIWKAYNPPQRKPKENMKTLGMILSRWPTQLGAEMVVMLEIKRNRTEPLLTR